MSLDEVRTAGPGEPPESSASASSDVAPEPADTPADPLLLAREALGRARRSARERGYRPGTARRRDGATDPSGLTDRRRGSRSGRDPQLLGDEVERLVAGRGWTGEVQVGSVVGRWPVIVGAEVARHVEPVSFTGTVLTVRAESTAWATQMTMLTSSVMARIEAEVGAGVVTQIVVHGPAGPSWRKGPLRARGRGPRDTYG